MSAFDLLAQPIQRALWNMHWMELRPIQEQAIPIVLQSDHDLIISARTAAGKTEAAFLPVLSAIQEHSNASVRAIYVGPLKALINDQFRRLEQLAELAQIPVHRWHGDVGANRKETVLQEPGGVLLITPESLEALFVNRGSALTALFHSLSFVVLDELHAMLGTERGLHLRSLLFRLQRPAKDRIRLIALSATLGDLPRSAAWLRPEAPDQVEILTDAKTQKSIKFRIHAYLQSEQRNEKKAPTDSPDIQGECVEQDTRGSDDRFDSGTVSTEYRDSFRNVSQAKSNREQMSSRRGIPPAMLSDLYEYFHGQKNLIFANSKSVVELCAEGLNQLCQQRGNRAEFLVHHGSLSKETREETETLIQGKLPYTAVCSSTLELGIDIGNVAAVGQIGAPHSVSSMAQRMGRSGRKDGEPHCMRIFIKATEATANDPIQEQLYLELIQAIAVTELMLQKWFEPPEGDQGDLSTLVQQILSILAETGGLRALEMFDRLVTNGAFRYVDQATFVAVLRSLGNHNLIEQMQEGDLILGLKGQKIVSHYDFYSAFASAEEFRVTQGGRLIGNLPSANVPHSGEQLMLGGRGWQVVDVYRDRREISVVPSRGSKAPDFPPSDRTVHAKIRQQMRTALSESNELAYLSGQAGRMLSQARQAARTSGVLDGNILNLNDCKCQWFPWTGTDGLRTLEALGMSAGLTVKLIGHPPIAIEFSHTAQEVREKLHPFLSHTPSAIELAANLQPKKCRKYDEYLSDDLLNWGLARSTIDLENALAVLKDA